MHQRNIQLGCGGISTDYLATVASFPNPDDKIRSLALKVQGGGNVGNALTAAARLGLAPRVISKVPPLLALPFPTLSWPTNTGRRCFSNDKPSKFESCLDQVANDAMGRSILKELQDDGVDTSYMVVCAILSCLSNAANAASITQ